jgi:hypothetical protein
VNEDIKYNKTKSYFVSNLTTSTPTTSVKPSSSSMPSKQPNYWAYFFEIGGGVLFDLSCSMAWARSMVIHISLTCVCCPGLSVLFVMLTRSFEAKRRQCRHPGLTTVYLTPPPSSQLGVHHRLRILGITCIPLCSPLLFVIYPTEWSLLSVVKHCTRSRPWGCALCWVKLISRARGW